METDFEQEGTEITEERSSDKGLFLNRLGRDCVIAASPPATYQPFQGVR
jgi:hypothetical protein